MDWLFLRVPQNKMFRACRLSLDNECCCSELPAIRVANARIKVMATQDTILPNSLINTRKLANRVHFHVYTAKIYNLLGRSVRSAIALRW